MIHIVRDIFHHQYTWEDIKRSELTELYIAMMIRRLGISLVGIFIPVYLYNLGYSIETAILFVAGIYAFRIPIDLIGAKIIGYYGPKHVMILANIFLILSYTMLLTLDSIGWSLALVSLTAALANGLFFTAYHIEFSKIQTSGKAGKQISKMFRVGKFAGAVGPLIGGVVSSFYGVPVTIFLAITLILISAVPLGLSPEPVRRKQHVTFKGFPWRETWRNILSNYGLGFDQVSEIVLWPLYVSVFVVAGDEYLGLGLISSVGLATSFFAAGAIGKQVDRISGTKMISIGTPLLSLGHLLRVFINSTPAALVFGVFSDPASLTTRMPYMKGMYAEASEYEGYRDAYISAAMVVANIARATSLLLVVFAIGWLGADQAGMQMVFALTSIVVWATMLQRYKSIK